MSEFGDSFDQAYAIHRAISIAISQTGPGARLSLAAVMQCLGAEASMIRRSDLIKAIVSAASDTGVQVSVDAPQGSVAS